MITVLRVKQSVFHSYQNKPKQICRPERMNNNLTNLIMNTNVICFAYEQYSQKLTDLLVPVIYEGFNTIWIRVKTKVDSKWHVSRSDAAVHKFQKYLGLIPSWNKEDIQKEGRRITAKLDCPYLEKLLEKVFLLQAQILSTLREKSDKIKIVIPAFEDFVHKCYSTASRRFMVNPGLFLDAYNKEAKLANMEKCMEIIRQSVLASVRDLLPLDKLLIDSDLTPKSADDSQDTHEDIVSPIHQMDEISEIEDEPKKLDVESLDPFEAELLRT